MSAFITGVDHRSAILITDGAAYDDAGVIQWLGPKVTVGKVAPIAVTTRGSRILGAKVQSIICDFADKYGVDYAIANFEREMPNLKVDPRFGGKDGLHFHIIAWSLYAGPVQISAHNLPCSLGDGQEPLKVYRPEGHYIAGTRTNLGSLRAAGVTLRREDETVVEYLEREGVKFMEAMRRCPATPLPGEEWEGDQYLIGGQVDVTVVDLWGVRTKTVRRWPEDRVGEKIVPERMREAA